MYSEEREKNKIGKRKIYQFESLISNPTDENSKIIIIHVLEREKNALCGDEVPRFKNLNVFLKEIIPINIK
jgi:hypothetical protein